MRIILFSMLFFFEIFSLSGCGSFFGEGSSKQQNMKVITSHDVTKKNEQIIKPSVGSSHLTQCNRDLESLRTVSLTAYRRYQSEYDGLMKSSAGFMAVRDDVSPEVAELARPKFQFALVNLCYRIKDALAQTLINQAGGR